MTARAGGWANRFLRLSRRAVLGIGLFLGSWHAAGATQVELELILAVDVSASVWAEEFDLQMRGYAEAFRTPQLVEAIKAAGGVAVSMMQWANPDQQEVTAGWTHVFDAASAERFATAVDATPRLFEMGQTAMGQALEFCLTMFPAKGFVSRRRVIDVSGDGYSNKGVPPNGVRDRAARAGITVNGLPITSKERFLPGYYERNVIGGPGAFLIVAKDYSAFAEAIVAKLIREVRGAHIAGAPEPSGGADRALLAAAGGS